MISSKGQIVGCIRLCTAIVNSGVKEKDQIFLESEWYRELVAYITDFNKEHNTLRATLMIPKRTGDRNE